MPDVLAPRRIEIRPQPKQEMALKNPADVIIFGGSRGTGKTSWLLFECARHANNPKFGSVIFRRSIPEIIREGGLWDEAHKMYAGMAKFNENEHTIKFNHGARVTMAHLQYTSSLSDWLGAQIGLLAFDQLEGFEEKMFFDLWAANRSTSGIRPYIRATCNPLPGWLCDFVPEKTGFISYWIDESGYSIPERWGVIRWMVRKNEQIYWADSAEELVARFPGENPKSVTYIGGSVYDNPILLDMDSGYIANLQAQDDVTRERWLGDPIRGGNWRIREKAGNVFDRNWFKVIEYKDLPLGPYEEVRFWDFAATERKLGKRDPDWTAGTKIRFYRVEKKYVVMDAISEQIEPAATDELVLETARVDGALCAVRWEREGGASGKRDSYNMVTKLRGYDAAGVPSEGDKIQRAKPLATQARVGNVLLLTGPWNELFKNQLHSFPEGRHDDLVDSSSSAFSCLTEHKKTVRAL